MTGKYATELLAVLAGSRYAYAGTVNVNGFDPAKTRTACGYAPADAHFFGEMTVAEALTAVATLRGVPATHRARQVGALTELAGLDALRGRRLAGLTLPQLRRFAVLQAAVGIGETGLMLLDDPALGLNEEETRGLAELILAVRGECTVLIACDDPGTLGICDQILELTDREGALLRGAERPRQLTIHLTVRGERDAIFGALGAVEGIEEARPGVPTEDGCLPIVLIAAGGPEDADAYAGWIRTELSAAGLETVSLMIPAQENGDRDPRPEPEDIPIPEKIPAGEEEPS